MQNLRATRREALTVMAGAGALAVAGGAGAEDQRPPSGAPPGANALGAHFGFTKLVVGDLEKCAAFYRAVCGVEETGRVDAEIAGRRISEVLFAPTAAGGATPVLLAFHDAPKPAAGEVILGAITTDIDSFFARAIAAGGTLIEAIHEMPALKIKVGFAADPEGHWIEVVQQLG
jgi:catechol 2,3-dioxygenase-like lactoylglutathione lyase family enzyme